MIEAFSTTRHRNRTLILLAICAGLAIAAAALGIEDNLPGLLLAFLAANAFILAFVHPWKTSKKFRNLAIASALVLIVFTVLQIVLDLAFSKPGGADLATGLLDIVVNAFYIAVILLCLAGLLVGVIGAVVMVFRQRHSHPPARNT